MKVFPLSDSVLGIGGGTGKKKNAKVGKVTRRAPREMCGSYGLGRDFASEE